jgi:hypothetical protein
MEKRAFIRDREEQEKMLQERYDVLGKVIGDAS